MAFTTKRIDKLKHPAWPGNATAPHAQGVAAPNIVGDSASACAGSPEPDPFTLFAFRQELNSPLHERALDRLDRAGSRIHFSALHPYQGVQRNNRSVSKLLL